MPENTNVQNYEDQKVAGLGGWLLVFIIFSIVCLVWGCFKIYKELKEIGDFLALTADIYCVVFLLGLWLVFWFYCLYLIVIIDKNAIRRIKLLLILNPIANLFLVPIVSLVVYALTVDQIDIIEEIYNIYSSFSYIGLFAPLIFSFVWYWYFSVSVRVKNTWGAQQ